MNLNTMWPQVPTIVNNNFKSVERSLNVIYNETSGVIIVPITTTGRIKGATGEFVTCVVDNLIVKKQYTNMLSNVTTVDSDYYNTYIGSDASYRTDSSTAWDSSLSNVWESKVFKYIDVVSPYYKIRNDVSIAFNTENLGQVVEVLFDVAVPNTNFNIRLDGSTKGNKIVVSAVDSSKCWMQLICVADDPSLGNTWAVKQYGGTYTKTTW